MDNRLIEQAKIISHLHDAWEPHVGQVEAGRALFLEGKQYLFIRAGRKWGKSEMSIYILYRIALTQPNSSCYYIAPFAKQARELIWANNRIQYFLKKEYRDYYIDQIYQQDMRIRFRNGSFIKLDGADNYEAYRGINPHAVVYDEFKDHHPRFHEGMEPNLAPFKAPLVVIGTPPDTEFNHFFSLEDSIRQDPGDGKTIRMPTWKNPHIDKSWLEKMKARMIARGDYDVWLREYEAKFVKGGKNHIFPMLGEKHQCLYENKVPEIKGRYKDYDLVIAADPGTASCFAVLFTAVHRYNKSVIVLDELYITSTMESSVRKVWSRIKSKMEEVMQVSDIWIKVYDEAATWFQNELMDITHGEVFFAPTNKKLNKKEEGLSLIKDLLLFDKILISERCENLYTEMSNYIKGENNKIPKKNDHLIDCLRYALGACHYSHIPLTKEEKERDEYDDFKEQRCTLDGDRLEIIRNKDWIYQITGEDYYE
jgi:hypothetical protein